MRTMLISRFCGFKAVSDALQQLKQERFDCVFVNALVAARIQIVLQILLSQSNNESEALRQTQFTWSKYSNTSVREASV